MESDAILNIVQLAGKNYIIFGSFALDEELAACPYEKQRLNALALYNRAVSARAEHIEHVFNQYIPIAMAAGIRGMDTLHLCYAIAAEVDYLLTTDEKFLKRAAKLTLPIKVINPINLPIGGTL